MENCKAALCPESDIQGITHDESFITASPLDYHLFRQEITSKYPAYNPPPPLVPIEDQNNSILPPLSTHPSRQASQENLQATASNISNANGSIFHQPVHIATPAPSPPPSPAGPGGKGGKKQNYQTNQNFPFLYPPLDDTSSTVGGKGNAGLQDQPSGSKWGGSDVPASILEAGQLFASRMRMSRSIRQLWDVREKYIKSERGWNGPMKDRTDSTCETMESKSSGEVEADEGVGEGSDRDLNQGDIDLGSDEENEVTNELIRRRLDALNDFYVSTSTSTFLHANESYTQRDTLPNLQSVVMVLWKILLSSVSALVAQNGQNGLPNGFPEDGEAPNRKRPNHDSSAHLNGVANGQLADNEDGTDPVVEELNGVRSREITSKAVSGVLLLLLKWFKLSRTLKYNLYLYP